MFLSEAMRRMAQGGQQGPLPVLKMEQKYELTHDQLHQVRPLLEAHIASIRHSGAHRGLSSFPAWWLHKPKDLVRGTALLFHGFAANNDQVRALGQYLFENGFNVYAPAISGHEFADSDKYWPKVEAREVFKQQALDAINQDPELREYFAKREPPYEHQALRDTVMKLRRVTPFMRDMEHAAKHGKTDKNFTGFFEEQPHTQVGYLQHAQVRLAEVRALPGPVIALGVDLGATIALALASTEPIGTISKVFAINPLLQIKNDFVRDMVHLGGPIGLHESSQYNDKEYYSLGCDVASSLLGNSVQSNSSVEKLSKVETCFVYVDKGSVSDRQVNENFVIRLSKQDRSVPHTEILFNERDVRAPALEGDTNLQWANLYQQVLNFASEGQFDASELTKAGQSDKLPQVRVKTDEPKPQGLGGALMKAFGQFGKFGQRDEQSATSAPAATSAPPKGGLPKSYITAGGVTSAPSVGGLTSAAPAIVPEVIQPSAPPAKEDYLPYKVVTDTPGNTQTSNQATQQFSQSYQPSQQQSYQSSQQPYHVSEQSYAAPPVTVSKLDAPHSYYATSTGGTPGSHYATPTESTPHTYQVASSQPMYPSVASPYAVVDAQNPRGPQETPGQQEKEPKQGPQGIGGQMLNALGNFAKNLGQQDKKGPAYGY